MAAIVGSGLTRRPGRREVWVPLGITAVYGMAVLRMSGSPEERTHPFRMSPTIDIMSCVVDIQSLFQPTAGGSWPCERPPTKTY